MFVVMSAREAVTEKRAYGRLKWAGDINCEGNLRRRALAKTLRPSRPPLIALLVLAIIILLFVSFLTPKGVDYRLNFFSGDTYDDKNCCHFAASSISVKGILMTLFSSIKLNVN